MSFDCFQVCFMITVPQSIFLNRAEYRRRLMRWYTAGDQRRGYPPSEDLSLLSFVIIIPKFQNLFMPLSTRMHACMHTAERKLRAPPGQLQWVQGGGRGAVGRRCRSKCQEQCTQRDYCRRVSRIMHSMQSMNYVLLSHTCMHTYISDSPFRTTNTTN